jgi:hypothetical protein
VTNPGTTPCSSFILADLGGDFFENLLPDLGTLDKRCCHLQSPFKFIVSVRSFRNDKAIGLSPTTTYWRYSLFFTGTGIAQIEADGKNRSLFIVKPARNVNHCDF